MLNDTQAPDERQYTSLTPSGIEVLYQSQPKRLYKVRQTCEGSCQACDSPEECVALEWTEVPSVTQVLGILDKPGLPWWGMKVGVQGIITLHNQGRELLIGDTVDDLVGLLTQEKLTVNHMRDKAGDRGVAVHDAFEGWAKTGNLPDPSIYPEEEKGYVAGLWSFLNDVCPEPLAAEVMVGSVEHGFAGRYDIRLRVPKECLVVHHRTPKRGPQYAKLKPGTILGDLKTSKDVYATHSLQLEAYEQASVECGYEPTVARGILNVGADGTYKFVRSIATFDDFANVLAVYRSLESMKERKR